MVSNIHIVMDDRKADRVKAAKDQLDLTWEQYLMEATAALEQQEGLGEGGVPE